MKWRRRRRRRWKKNDDRIFDKRKWIFACFGIVYFFERLVVEIFGAFGSQILKIIGLVYLLKKLIERKAFKNFSQDFLIFEEGSLHFHCTKSETHLRPVNHFCIVKKMQKMIFFKTPKKKGKMLKTRHLWSLWIQICIMILFLKILKL